jgi:hypothetical protein
MKEIKVKSYFGAKDKNASTDTIKVVLEIDWEDAKMYINDNPEKYKDVTCTEYLEKHGQNLLEKMKLNMVSFFILNPMNEKNK